MTDNGAAHGYARVSTDEQGASGLGIEAQRAAIEAAAHRLGLSLTEVHVDSGLSGKLAIERRPALLDAVAAVRKGDVLLVAKRDRLGRDVIAVAMIERLVARKGGRVVSAAGEGTEADDPTAILMRRIVDAFAEYERLLIGARTRAALRAKRARGERAGACPFGWRVVEGRRLEPVAEERAALDVIRGLRARGEGYRGIARELTARGVRPKRQGARWSDTSVKSVLRTEEAEEHARATRRTAT